MGRSRSALPAVAAALVGLALFAPPALATTADPRVASSAISCTAPGDCTAIANYKQAIGFGQGLLLTETNGKWASGITAQLPANAAADPIEDGLPAGTPASTLDRALDAIGLSSVQCSSPGNCTAVGAYVENRDETQGMILTETNGRWARGVEATLAPKYVSKRQRLSSLTLSQLSCPAAGDCVAAGWVSTATGTAPVVFTETGGHWGQGVVLTAAGSAISFISGISCPRVGGCVIVGGSMSLRLVLQPIVFAQHNGGWTSERVKLPANAKIHFSLDLKSLLAGTEQGAYLSAVSCAPGGGCTVAGSYEDTRLQVQAFTATQDAGGWSQGTELTLPAGAVIAANSQDAQITGLDCPVSGDCSAVGSYTDNNGNSQGLLLNESAGSWAAGTRATLPAPFKNTVNGQTVSFSGISCASAGNCVATGSYNYGSYLRPRVSLVVTEHGGSWSAGANLTLPSDQAHLQSNFGSAVSCTAIIGLASSSGNNLGACTIAGSFTDLNANLEGFASSGDNGTFSQPVEFQLPGVDRTELLNSLISVLKPTSAYVSTVRRAGGLTYNFTAAERGVVTTSWTARGANGLAEQIGTASAHVAYPGVQRIKLRLNAAGRRLFATSKSVRVTAVASFSAAPSGRARAVRVTRTASFVVGPAPKRLPFGSAGGYFDYGLPSPQATELARLLR